MFKKCLVLFLLLFLPLFVQSQTENQNTATNTTNIDQISATNEEELSARDSLTQFESMLQDLNTVVSPPDTKTQEILISNLLSTYINTKEGNLTEESKTFMEKVRTAFKNNTSIANLLISILVIILLWFTRLIILRIVWKNTDEANIRYRWRKISSYIALGLGIILISQIWIEEFSSILTYLGLVSAGIAIALKDFIVNFLGWVFIMTTKPFGVGDRIEMTDFAGDVIDIRAFEFTILEIGNWVAADQSTGRIMHIPNGKIFTEALANYNKAFEFIWNEIPITITFNSDWKRAKEILQQIADAKVSDKAHKLAERRIREASRHFMIYYTNLTPIVYTTVVDNGVLLTVRYLCDPRERRTTTTEIWEDILTAFQLEKNIEFAYSTVTLHKDDMNQQSDK